MMSSGRSASLICAVISLSVGCAAAENKNDSDPSADSPISVTVSGAGLEDPLDATPGPDGEAVWWLGTAAGVSGVWQIDRSTPLAEIAGGRNLVFSDDGATIFVSAAGGLFAVPAAGGAPALMPGTELLAPEGLDTVTLGGTAYVYATAPGAQEGEQGLYRISESGGVEAILTGAPFVAPGGVVVGADGVVWVVDQEAGLGASGALIRVVDGAATIVADSFIAGDPAGVAFTPDEGALMISSLDDSWHSQVLIVSAADYSTSVFNDVIGENDTSGGLHRADGTGSYAWADRRGTVYSIEIGG